MRKQPINLNQPYQLLTLSKALKNWKSLSLTLLSHLIKQVRLRQQHLTPSPDEQLHTPPRSVLFAPNEFMAPHLIQELEEDFEA